jgi:ferritin-like metal-binding protein YciE
MTISNLNELFVHELKDLYDAEHQLIQALPKLAKAAKDPKLAEAFQHHLEQTKTHVTRLETVFAACGEEPERMSCRGMKGLIDEGERLLKEDLEPEVVDAGLIGAAQRVEHYEIAAYGTLKVWAATAGLEEVLETLEETLEEEKNADDKLTEIAETGANQAAGKGTGPDYEPEEATPPVRKRSSTASRSAKPTRTRRTEPSGSKSRR